MKTKKIYIGIVALSTILMLNLINMKQHNAKADPWCNGWHWLVCKTGKWVVRCDCDGGSLCDAAWQDLCDEPE